MYFNEGIALMLIAKPLKALLNDYSIKTFLIYAVVGFVMLVLVFRLILNKLKVETILKLKGFYIVYVLVMSIVIALFLYMNYIILPTTQYSIDGMEKEAVQEYNNQIKEGLIRGQVEINKSNEDLRLDCEKSVLCNHVKKQSE